jgi:steroid delta-isomerase-like uncharacterized protein
VIGEANKALVRRYYEEIANLRALNVADELFAPNFRLFPDSSPGPEGVKQFITWLIEVFPDFWVRVDDLIAAEGNKVVARFAFGGTHQGEFLGIPATGKPLAMTEITIWRIAEGKIVERWIAANALDAVLQLGARVVPPTATDE